MREEQSLALVFEPATIHHRVTLRDMRPRSLSFPTKIAQYVSPSQADQDSFPTERIRVKKAFLQLAGAQEFKAWPNNFDDHPNEGWTRERPKLRRTKPQRSLDPQLSLNRAEPT